MGPPPPEQEHLRFDGAPKPATGPPSAVEVLRAHRAEQAAFALATGPAWQDDGYIFPSSIGTQWNSANFRHRFQKACVEAGIGHWTPHELRYTAATWLITGGIGLKVIADQLLTPVESWSVRRSKAGALR